MLLGVYKYIIITQFLEPATFPPYKGSTLRGAFGNIFKEIVCINKQAANCEECFVSSTCAYKFIFEPKRLKDNNKKIDVPPPFILEPPYDKKNEYKKGEYFKFQCIIIGKAIEYFPYFVLVFKKMGERGIGVKGKRGRFKLLKIKNNNKIIYDHRTDTLKNFAKPVKITFTKNKFDKDLLTLKFISPTRIKVGGKLINNLPFDLFLKVLIRRICILNKYYGDPEQISILRKYLNNNINSVSVLNSSLKWYDWQRFSYRQRSFMKLGGFVGSITYKGDFKKYLNLIKLGEVIHIGKNCSFGLGKYEMKLDSQKNFKYAG